MFRVVKAVLWAFLGIRKQSEYDQDSKSITPVQAIVTGIVLALCFVIGLIVLVKFLVAR
jgi:hypothetical protein